ncbi:MAG: UDP-2,4-diacetamido-2,4,6-trideoxy-beta-L-altropyranose hydrolase [Acidaminococcales bacterium]|jgi:UDP-2,4-diacetamido-2,4,6-trideoxy-beta-L-altropyranose hydrolase|nr:UDP-2,4-diacetamido-2,4,6-trideoxy-beta-L-altropyranose hydrolase [Acidaminococcales bacterium]
MKQSIVFRTDSSPLIGGGHLMRCIALAETLKKEAAITFICRDLPGNVASLAENRGFGLKLLPFHGENPALTGYEKWLAVPSDTDAAETQQALREKADCLIVDHYSLGLEWERKLRPYAGKIIVIDDLADKPHDCDILANQSFEPGLAQKYGGLTPAGCRQFLGPEYAVLREEFYLARQNLRRRTGKLRNALIFFGGGDYSGETGKVLLAMEGAPGFTADVVVGGGNERKDEIGELCARLPWAKFHCQIDYMAALANEADLAIGAGGLATVERCFLGLPSLIVSTADNQETGVKMFAALGFAEYLGKSADVAATTWREAILRYKREPERLLRMSQAALKSARTIGSGAHFLKEAILRA